MRKHLEELSQMKLGFVILIALMTLSPNPGIDQNAQAQTDAIWIGGNDTWNDVNNWGGGVVPNNNGTTFNVLIDDGVGGTNSVVALDLLSTIDNLTVDVGDILNFNNSFDLTIVEGGVIANSGVINLNATTAFTDLIIGPGGGDVTLNGGGTIDLAGITTFNRIFGSLK